MNVHVVNHPLVAHKLTMMRDKTCNSKNFRELLGEIASLMTYDVTKDWETEPVEIETPLEKTTGYRLKGEVTIIPILRAGLGLLNGVMEMIPHARVGHIGLYRDPQTLEPVEYYCKLPPDSENRELLVLDPMLASGGSACAAISAIKARGCHHIRMVNLIAAPEGIARVQKEHPDVDS